MKTKSPTLSRPYFFFFLGALLLPFLLRSQDPFYVHFFNNKSDFNPAMVGSKGALSLNLKYKDQWGASTIQPFRSFLSSVEESVPCSPFDYGFSFSLDEEGAGLLQTMEAGGKLAMALWRPSSTFNVRLGIAFQLAQKSIHFERLTFADQLDPKYGLVDENGMLNPTAFNPPNDNSSHWFFTPAVGVVFHRGPKDRYSKLASVLGGISFHNLYSVGGKRTGNTESLLDIGTRIPFRVNAFAESEWILSNLRGNYVTITPFFLYSHQASLHYFQAGTKLWYNRLIAVGASYHFNNPSEEGANTNWFTFSVELGSQLTKSNRFDLGFSYSNNFTGLRNIVGPIVEVSVSFHFLRSPVCAMLGKDNPLTNPGIGSICPTFTPANKIYENIWYRSANK